ncbi:winged helix-turn-helix domain-containing protein [Streptomyces sp. NBC_00154]|uniref:helix-turn-helix domain-containing protein n=1 Tax=Streptomyces sp. NBC_00154 TaxID=2975670 RepID=UPI002B1E23E1|nr:winged helix-turn-helix domain-containing protein [Streptomyces sp. NBC_00154]
MVRIRALIIRLFLVEYTVQGVWKLMRRHGWSPQVPARRALERDDASVERWRSEVWETVKPPRRPRAPTSASRTKQDRD